MDILPPKITVGTEADRLRTEFQFARAKKYGKKLVGQDSADGKTTTCEAYTLDGVIYATSIIESVTP